MILPVLAFIYFLGLLPHSTLSTDLSNVTYLNLTDCLAFFAQRIYLVNTKSSQRIALPALQNFDSSKSKCESGTTALTFSFKNVQEVSSMDIRLQFSIIRQHWKVSESNFNLTCNGHSSTCTSISNGRLSLDWLDAPTGFSYKCTKPSLVRAFDAAGSPTTQALQFHWIQVQPFGAKGGRFSKAVDCIGFFTIPIWSTLVISFLLVGILTYGLIMLMSVKPFELYDDPMTTKAVQLGSAN